MNTNETPTLKKDIMRAIREGKVHMRPRWRYILSGTLAALGGAILFLTLLYIVSFGIFMLRQSGAFFVPIFGWRGLFAFFAALPVVLIVLLAAFVVILEILVQRYRVGYRTPLLVSAGAILGIVLLGGYALERTHIHEVVLEQARGEGALPALRMIYPTNGHHMENIYRGTIISMTSSGFEMLDDTGIGTTSVRIDRSTRLPLGADFGPGEKVVVFGDEASGTVHAYGVREIDD